jgi:hypothetical protein
MVRPSPQGRRSRTGCTLALGASLAACSGTSPHAGASRDVADGSRDVGAVDAADASRPAEDATAADASAGQDAGPNEGGSASEGGSNDGGANDGGANDDTTAAECANETVPPSTLQCTGLYADIVTKALAPGVRFYQPAVPLWSDNAQKTRWILLPAGTTIDVSDPTEWVFPVGTKVWKEFSRNGKRIETRLFQKTDVGPPSIWAHAAYAWNADESGAVVSYGADIALDSDGGPYHIPTFAECEKCHNGRSDHLLGFEQVSLGLAGAQGLTLSDLAAEGLIAPAVARTQLAIGDDGTGAAAPALAWLHINCGTTCHNANSSATAYATGVRLRLDPAVLDGRPLADIDPLKTTIGVPATTPWWAQPVQWTRIVPGDAAQSLLVQLISNRGRNNPAGGQMPPIATSIVDTDDVAKVVDWVNKMHGSADAGATDASVSE